MCLSCRIYPSTVTDAACLQTSEAVNHKTITSCVSACTEHTGRCCRHYTLARSRSTSRQLPSMPSWLQRHEEQESESKRAKVSESKRARERVLSLFLSLSTCIHILKATASAESEKVHKCVYVYIHSHTQTHSCTHTHAIVGRDNNLFSYHYFTSS